ncbi:MAG: hypothetical protein EP343_13740 [Deltaproteobacteria bacterium]|nr:MAG: hypothetical protein EP343_13740 [Deltaproteobacteria bacterium]
MFPFVSTASTVFQRMGWLCLLALVLCLQPLPAQGQPTYKGCIQQYRQKRYIASSQCFAQVAENIKAQAAGNLTEKQRVRRGRALRNAANAIRRGAPKVTDVSQRAYLYEQGALYLKQYLAEKLYETNYLKKSALYQRRELESKVGRTTLSVVAGAPKAQIRVQGYKLDYTAKAKWNRSVRPGFYTITVTYPWESKPLRRTIAVAPKTPKLLALQPPAKPTKRRRPVPPRTRRDTPPIARTTPPQQPASSSGLVAAKWVLLGLGSAVVVAGVVTLALGQSANTRKIETFQALSGSSTNNDPTKTQEILADDAQSQTLIPLGWTLSSVGLASAVVGVVLFALPSKPKPSPLPPKPAPKKSVGQALFVKTFGN